MRLTLVDRIVDLERGKSITATKSLTMAEEYLKDHFPLFPVMPGVMMLESMYQTAAWLVRVSEDFAHSMVVLGEAKNVKFSDFVVPGECLTVRAELVKNESDSATLKCEGVLGNGTTAVRGRLVLQKFNLADSNAGDAAIDRYTIKRLREKLKLLYAAGNSETIR